MKRAALHNLGCKVNAYETEAMQQMLEEAASLLKIDYKKHGEDMEARFLAYKASFNMTVASKPDSTALQALQSFLTDLGIDKKSEVFTTCIKGYTGYIETLVNEIM